MLHYYYGLFCVFLPPWLQLIIVTCFSLYEWLEHDKPRNKVGDVLEFLVGYLVGLYMLIVMFGGHNPLIKN